MWKIMTLTSLFVAVVLTFLLKVLRVFHWLKWHPTTFLKGDITDGFLRWIVLGILIFCGACILFIGLQFLYRLPTYIVGFVLGLGLAIVFEWWLLDLPWDRSSIKHLSIPFLVLITSTFIFITETATYHRESFVLRNNLPSKGTMLE